MGDEGCRLRGHGPSRPGVLGRPILIHGGIARAMRLEWRRQRIVEAFWERGVVAVAGGQVKRDPGRWPPGQVPKGVARRVKRPTQVATADAEASELILTLSQVDTDAGSGRKGNRAGPPLARENGADTWIQGVHRNVRMST